MFSKGSYKRILFECDWSVREGLEIFQKRIGAWQEKGGEKIEEGGMGGGEGDTQRSYAKTGVNESELVNLGKQID